MKILSSEDIRYRRSELVKLLQRFEPVKEHFTFEFYRCASCFTGDSGRLLRRCLWTLVALGYVQHHPPNFNHNRWSITEKGIEYLSTYDPLNPSQLGVK